jgi:hypothetical protein
MQMPEIERGIPVEPRYVIKEDTKSSLVAQLEVGESLFCPGETQPLRSNWQSIASHVARRDGRKFTTKSVVKGGRPGLRIWRIR